MYSTLITIVALFAAPALAAFAVNDPELTQCGTSKISWEKTQGPYNVIAVSAADPCGEPLAEIGDFEGSSIQWKATIPAGTIVQISIADASDDEAWSKNITVGASSDSSCLSSSSASASTTAAGSSTTSTSTTTTSSDSTTGDNSDGDSDSSLTPVGAANAGSNKFLSAAPSARQASVPIMALSAIAAVAALAL